MNVDVRQIEAAVTVLTPHGRLNMLAAPALRELIGDTVDTGHRRIVIDLSETVFMDSSGLGALIAGLKVARAAGGDLRLARPSPQVLAVLQLTNLHKVLRPHPSAEEAFGA